MQEATRPCQTLYPFELTFYNPQSVLLAGRTDKAQQIVISAVLSDVFYVSAYTLRLIFCKIVQYYTEHSAFAKTLTDITGEEKRFYGKILILRIRFNKAVDNIFSVLLRIAPIVENKSRQCDFVLM